MSKIPKARYTTEFRAQAVKLVLEKGLTVPEAAASLGVPEQTFGNWLRVLKKAQAIPVGDASGRMVCPQDAEIARLRRELAEAKMERDGRVLCQGIMPKYAFIKQQRTVFPVLLMCRVLEVSRSGFYDWLALKPSARQQSKVLQEVAVRAAHQKTRQTYGARRLHTELTEEGHSITAWQVRKVKERLNLRCIQAQKFKATTHLNHSLPMAENLLGQCFEPVKPNEMWVSDITYSTPSQRSPH